MPLSPLHRTARLGDVAALDGLLAEASQGAPAAIDARSPCGWTPLAEAAWAGQDEALRRLLEAGADPDASSLDGLTPLMLAAGQGHRAIVERLLAVGADPDAVADDGRSPLESAIQGRHLDIARALIEAGASLTDACGALWLRALVVLQGRRCRLLEPRDREDHRWVWAVDGPLRLAAEDIEPLRPALERIEGSEDAVERVILGHPLEFRTLPALFGEAEAGAPLPSNRWRYRKGWTERAEAVLHGEIPPDEADQDGYLSTLEAIRHHQPGALQALIEVGASPDVLPPQGCMRGATLLLNAAHLGDADCVDVLLRAGAGLDTSSFTGWTALMAAAARGHLAVVQRLVKAGADLELRNAQGQTALAVAQSRGHAAVARALLVVANARQP